MISSSPTALRLFPSPHYLLVYSLYNNTSRVPPSPYCFAHQITTRLQWWPLNAKRRAKEFCSAKFHDARNSVIKRGGWNGAERTRRTQKAGYSPRRQHRWHWRNSFAINSSWFIYMDFRKTLQTVYNRTDWKLQVPGKYRLQDLFCLPWRLCDQLGRCGISR
jgi:hypothetical protein